MRTIPFYIAFVIGVVLNIHAAFSQSKSSDDEETTPYYYDHIPEVSEDTIEARLARLENEVPLTYNARVQGFINYFLIKDRSYTRDIAALQTKYFPIIEKYLAAYGLPDELKYLAIVESGLNPRARSRAGAVGLWQFMPLTGRLDYDLYENWYSDHKMDFERSTIAACRYLSFLYKYFDNDWHLALAAYNSGPGNVRKAIRRSGYKKSFWEIYPYLFRETRSYVPQYIALTYAMNHLEEHNIFIEAPEYLPEYDTLEVQQFLNLELFAERINTCLPVLEELNPELKHKAISSKSKAYAIRIPAHKKDSILQDRAEILQHASQGEESWERFAKNEVGSTYGRQKLSYKVRSGDVLGVIANRYQVRISDIKTWNNLHSNTIRVGQRLNIWVKDDFYDGVNEKMAQITQAKTNTQEVAKSTASGYYEVQQGDTLWDISRKFDGLTVDKLKKLNNLNGNEIKPGQKLKIG